MADDCVAVAGGAGDTDLGGDVQVRVVRDVGQGIYIMHYSSGAKCLARLWLRSLEEPGLARWPVSS